MRFRVTFPKDTPTLFRGETISFYELNRGEDWKKFKALFVEIRKKNVLYCEWHTMVDGGNESLGVAVLNLTGTRSAAHPRTPRLPPACILCICTQ